MNENENVYENEKDLLGAQRYHRIHLPGAVGGEPARETRDGNEQQGGTNQNGNAVGVHAGKPGGDELGEPDRTEQPDGGAHESESATGQEDHAVDVDGLRP